MLRMKLSNKITDEIFHEEVQKEISRRQTMEQNRQQRTSEELRGGIPTNLPEMSAQQRVEETKAPEAFNIASDEEMPTIDVDPIPETLGPSGVPFILRRKKVPEKKS